MSDIDVLENRLQSIAPQLLELLLIDQTKTKNSRTPQRIFWATSDYENLGPKFAYAEPITPELITGKNGQVIRPRVLKDQGEQSNRSRIMAEVYTPAWLCNEQNNLVDAEWFSRPDVFNRAEGQSWQSNPDPITFPQDKTWQDYVKAIRLEVTCGEAPYLVSRYDMTSGSYIPVQERVGLLDRKLRVVSENTKTPEEWLEWAQIAFCSVYGFEWQGDSLLLARENLLFTFGEFYQERWHELPALTAVLAIAEIISWNLWQMDGLRGVIPNSCENKITYDNTLFGLETYEELCPGCQREELLNSEHNGTYCLIKDWTKQERGTLGKIVRFVDLF